MEVHVALGIGNRTPTLLEIFLEFSDQIESEAPVIFLPTPRSNHQVHRGPSTAFTTAIAFAMSSS
jgi:hypothetical protein